MGALPKRKISKGRKNRRRAHDHLDLPAMSICPKCKKMKLPHHVCPFCKYYGEPEKTVTPAKPVETAAAVLKNVASKTLRPRSKGKSANENKK